MKQFSIKSLNYKNHLHISSDNQLRWAMIFSVLYSVIIVVLTVAIAVGAGRCPMNLTLIFLLFLIEKVKNCVFIKLPAIIFLNISTINASLKIVQIIYKISQNKDISSRFRVVSALFIFITE